MGIFAGIHFIVSAGYIGGGYLFKYPPVLKDWTYRGYVMTKEENKFFVDQLYMGNWEGEGWFRWGASLFRKVFAEWGSDSKLPVIETPIFKSIISKAGARVQLRLSPSNPHGDRSHRVHVYCDKCGTWVCAGRVHQHRC